MGLGGDKMKNLFFDIDPIPMSGGDINFNTSQNNSGLKKISLVPDFIQQSPSSFPLEIIQASDPIQEERLSICKSCEFYKNESGEPSCGQCGCPLKQKISIAEESCPLQKWAAIKTQSSGGCGCGKK